MSRLTTEELIDLMNEIIIPFYLVKRHNPMRFDNNRKENDAEHCWSVAFVAMTLAPHIDNKLDVGKICQYATVHDLVEVYAGDTPNFAAADFIASKEKRENEGLVKLEKYLENSPWITEIVKEYESQKSIEAKFVRSVDKLLPLLIDIIEEGHFYKEEKMTLTHWLELMQNHRIKAASHPEVYKYYLDIWEILTSNPQFYYQEN